MTTDLKKLLERHRKLIETEKVRLGSLEQQRHAAPQRAEDEESPAERQEENVLNDQHECREQKTAGVVESLDLAFEPVPDSQLFVATSKSPFFRSDEKSNAMLRIGEYSPNNPNLRVAAAPFLGLGEYEQRKHLVQQRRKNDYREYLTKKSSYLTDIEEGLFSNYDPGSPTSASVQTDIQNIHSKLVQYDLHSKDPAEKELSPQSVVYDKENHIMHSNRSSILDRLDGRYGSSSLYGHSMEKPRSILTNRRTESPRERLTQDLNNSYVPSFLDGFSYQDKTEELQRERLKREMYQQELKMQIEEKRRMAMMRDEQERREQELENKRLEQQLLRMQEEQYRDEQRRSRRDEQMRQNTDDFIRRKQELQARHGYRKHCESESGLSNYRNSNSSTKLSHYSPPVSRRNPYSLNIPSSSVFSEPTQRYNPSRYDSLSRKDMYNRMDSLSMRDSYRMGGSSVNRYDSLSRIDTLNRQEALSRLESLNLKDSFSRVQRRHSATQQDLSMLRRSPKAQRRNSSGRYDDTLPIPVLKAHSPVARELKNSVAVSSSRLSSESVRRLEDKWQVPAIQKNILSRSEGCAEGRGGASLTQLGAMRMQLQQVQMQMDEMLRKRALSQSKAVDSH